MATKRRQDGKWVLDTAKEIALRLKQEKKGTSLRIRMPRHVLKTGNTDGWRVVIGDLGPDKPKLEIWFDRISGYEDRKFNAAFHSTESSQIEELASQVSRRLWPVRRITSDELVGEKKVAFKKRLGRDEFNEPILENYEGGNAFYSIFDPTRFTKERINYRFCDRATAFFLDVANAAGVHDSDTSRRDNYPSIENRKVVASHQRRERSGYLAVECKIRDDYQCQVCGFQFEDVYGSLGRDFAEAHHRIPLGKQSGKVHTRLEDLITVCANCHRMLHRMEGKEGDVEKLKKIVQNQKRGR